MLAIIKMSIIPKNSVYNDLIDCSLEKLCGIHSVIEMFLYSFFTDIYVLDEYGLVLENNCYAYIYIKKEDKYFMHISVKNAEKSFNCYRLHYYNKKFELATPINTDLNIQYMIPNPNQARQIQYP